MMVWIPTAEKSSQPLPAPSIAYRSKVSASKKSKLLSSVKDQYEPLNSNDRSRPYYHWWPDKDKWEWIQYDFEKPEKISKIKVYWFDDGSDGECRIPDDWELVYKSGNEWKPVKATTPCKVTKDVWNILTFDPITTSAVKIRIKLKKDFSGGIHEWIIE
jgi:hypothetical protein